MANSVFLSGLLQVTSVRDVDGLGIVVQAEVFEREARKSRSKGWDERKVYPVLLTGERARVLMANNHTDERGLPRVAISGRLFRLDRDSQCFVLCKNIQFTGAYGKSIPA
ncbi:MAG: hypothetical protein U9O54_05385 [Chloroflexota bacterium]|nr:hypothetical protein [Chloroflexota bacterium]